MTRHWFSDAPNGVLGDFNATMTKVERNTLLALLTFANETRNSPNELLHCLDAEGLQVIDTSTGVKVAPITDTMVKAMEEGRGVRLWHNHPSQDSLSHTDWLCASGSEMIEILSVNNGGSIFVGRVPASCDAFENVFKEAPSIGGMLEFEMLTHAKRQNLDADFLGALSALTGHVLNLGFARSGVCQYAHYLSPSNQTTIAIAEAHSVLNHGLDYVEREVKAVLACAAQTDGFQKKS